LASNQENEAMNTTELRQKDVAGLKAEVKALQKAHFGLRMQKATQQLNNTMTLRTTRRDIARAKTILVEKQVAVAANTSKA
jgi:large subunit ribosomal protein L29